jgi:arylsulfatase A-like enzyme
MHVVDWLPTIAHITGYRPSGDLQWDGFNQWTALTGGAVSGEPRAIYIATKNGHALHYGDWKLIVPAKGKPELFNLAVDPYEKNDLAATDLRRVAEMQEVISEQQAKDDPVLPKDVQGFPN